MVKFSVAVVLVLSSLSGSAQVQPPGPTGIITTVEWVPNGKALVLSIMLLDASGNPVPPSRAYRYDLEKQKLTLLYLGGAGPVSPDGKTIIFSKRNQNGNDELFFYDMGSGSETLLVSDTTRLFSPAWSPDGKRIVYNKGKRTQPVRFSVLDLNTKAIKQISPSDKFNYCSPQWSPDGTRIVYFLEKSDSHDQLYLTDATGSFSTNLTQDKTSHNFYPSWLDDKTILYTQDNEKIMTIKIKGNKKAVLLIPPAAPASRVVYNAMTNKIAYSTLTPESKLYVFDLTKKKLEVVLDQEILKKNLKP